MDPIYDLSQNETRVLHSLIKWPSLSDQEIHNKISMKKSTFSSIKTRLRDQNYYRRVYVPNFPRIGFELLLSMHGHLNRFTSFQERMRIARETLESFEEDFHVISESNKAFNLSVSENYTEYSKNQQKFNELYAKNKFLSKDGMSVQAYPFEITRIHSFLDYESLIAKLFGFVSQPYHERNKIPTGSVDKSKLTRAERKVLVGLIKYPDETDTLIADEVGVSRNTVANAKKKFHKNDICFPRVIPNVKKLGYKLLVFQYRKFNPARTKDERKDAINKVRELLAPHYYVSKNLDGFLVSAHPSFEEYNRSLDTLLSYYMSKEYILEEPVTYKLSISNMHQIKSIDFLPMVLKRLGFDPEVPIAEQQ